VKIRALVDFTPHSWALLKRYIKRCSDEFDLLALVLYFVGVQTLVWNIKINLADSSNYSISDKDFGQI
jgi:hypothetical protein